MTDPLYSKDIMRLAADATGHGRLPSPDATATARNPTCGDTVKVDLKVGADSEVSGFAHETKACVLTQASASILGQSLPGATREDVELLANEIAQMLVTKGPKPAAPFEAYSVFEGAVEHRTRHRCVLLPIEAVLQAFDALEAPEPGGVGTKT